MSVAPLVHWIADAAAVLAGPRGTVTRYAHDVGQSRQSVYHHAHWVRSAVEAEQSGPSRQRLADDNRRLREENAQLWAWLEHTVEFPPGRRDEFAVTAAAMGLSLNQITTLLAIVLGLQAVPSRSALHRTIQAAGRAAGRVLRVLDERCRALVLVGCLDEIFFHRRPVLVAVEPASMTWFLGRRSGDCQGATWATALRPWSVLEFAVADAGTGLQAGIAQIQRERLKGGQVQLQGGLDVFHTTLEARRILARLWAKVERGWESYEVAARHAEADRRAGRDDERWAACAEGLWATVVAEFAAYEAAAAGWCQAHAALRVTRPDGRLNDRAWATEQVEAALPRLSGPAWSKVRSLLQSPGSWTFLDRLHRLLREAEPRDDLLGELIRLWCVRRQEAVHDSATADASAHAARLVQMLVCRQLDAGWHEAYQRVRRIPRGAVRASSAVECINSVLRMQQSRHRTVTQEMLDLKRLYWNRRAFREGKRRGRCPYEHLGVKLPSYNFRELLNIYTDVTLSSRSDRSLGRSRIFARSFSFRKGRSGSFHVCFPRGLVTTGPGSPPPLAIRIDEWGGAIPGVRRPPPPAAGGGVASLGIGRSWRTNAAMSAPGGARSAPCQAPEWVDPLNGSRREDQDEMGKSPAAPTPSLFRLRPSGISPS